MDSVLVINCGSSSAKLALYPAVDAEQPVLTAVAERLASEDGSRIKFKGAINLQVELGDKASHRQAIEAFLEHAKEHIGNLRGIGHRVVHGGEHFKKSTLVTPEVIEQLRPLNELAPLHNPANLQGVELCVELFAGVPNVVVFDTSFHQSLPEKVYRYATPSEWYENYGVRRYGFHGISYSYLTQATAQRLNKPVNEVNLLIAHLGNGCSATAVLNGESIDCSMGLTPLEGLVMGTRCGDIDPGLIEHLMRTSDLTFEEIMQQLNRNSGLKGLSGIGNDMRTLLEAEAAGNDNAKLAIEVFCFRVARHFAALSASLTELDAVVFSGGIGEYAVSVRERILANWKFMKFAIDPALNEQHGDEQGRITTADSPFLALVVPTDEERLIALDTYQLTETL